MPLVQKSCQANRSLINAHIIRVDVHSQHLTIRLIATPQTGDQSQANDRIIQIPWQKMSMTRRREILLPDAAEPQNLRPMSAKMRVTLIAAIARGRRWLQEQIDNPTATPETIAKRECCSVRKVNMTVSLAFLAPNLVKAAIEGHLPDGMGVTRLCELPAEWPRQYQALGLSA